MGDPNPSPPNPGLIQRRPAESVGILAGAVAALLGHLFNWDAETVGYVTIIVGALPAVVTFVVARSRRTDAGTDAGT